MSMIRIGPLSERVMRHDARFDALYLQYLSHFGVDCSQQQALRDLLLGLLRTRWISALSAYRQEEMVGFCIYSRTYSPVARSGAYTLDDLFVAPAHRRSGVASRLVEALTARARRRQVKRIYVRTDVAENALRAFYTRNGFVDADAYFLKLEIV